MATERGVFEMSLKLPQILDKLCAQHVVDRLEAEESLRRLASGEESESVIASFLTVFRMRNVTPQEILGFRDAMLSLAVRPELQSEQPPIDLCGTGGDGKDTFNISTLAAFVLAGSGNKVAKHGNYSASSVCGSSNVLEELGVMFSNLSEVLQEQLHAAHLCYFHAPLFHPAMKHVAPVRKALKVRTIFNLLGPTVNPLGVTRQLIGVFSYQMARLYAHTLFGALERFSIVFSVDGYDEVSLTGAIRIFTEQGENIVHPEDFGFDPVTPTALTGGKTVAESAKIFMDILSGSGTKEQNAVVVANAALALMVHHREVQLHDAVSLCQTSLESGSALQKFETFRDISQE